MADLSKGVWLNTPSRYELTRESVSISTEPGTDLWQRTYYGFKNDNAPALLMESDRNFTFTTEARFMYKARFDQCGLIVFLDNDNWFKASIEYENIEFSRLGSVVTNFGYSDWATTDIALPNMIWYRLNRRGPDFLIESSLDGENFRQMRIFHLHKLGETTEEMGKCNPPQPARNTVKFGVYACSPLDSSFTAEFHNTKYEPCKWLAHSA